MDPVRIADTACTTGEGPLWHPDERALYWCDIPNGLLYRYDPAADDHELVYDGDDALGGFTIQRDGSLLLFQGGGAIRRWADGQVATVREGISRESDSRFNDVIADPEGRVLAGTMPTGDQLGALYRVDTDGSVSVVHRGLDIPNGLAFSRDLASLYLTESDARTVHRFDYDRETGALSDRETFLATPAGEGVPEGLTIDSEGYLWSARWNGGCLVRYAPDGTEDRRVEFPARKVASVTFGGDGFGRRPDAPTISSLRYPWVATGDELREEFADEDRSLDALDDAWHHTTRSTVFAYLHVDDAASIACAAVESDHDGHEAFWAVAAERPPKRIRARSPRSTTPTPRFGATSRTTGASSASRRPTRYSTGSPNAAGAT